MDPITIDLTTVGGIVVATLAIIQFLKKHIAQIPGLQELPIAVYVVLASVGLTWFAHDVLHTLEGDRAELLVQAFMQALAASGALEWFRAGTKATADTKAGRSARGGFHVWPVLLAIGLSGAACASTGKLLVASEQGLHASITMLDDVATRACTLQLRTVAQCKVIDTALVAAYTAYGNYNVAAQSGSIAGVPAMVTALADLRTAAVTLEPQASAILEDLKQWHDKLKTLLPTKEPDDDAQAVTARY